VACGPRRPHAFPTPNRTNPFLRRYSRTAPHRTVERNDADRWVPEAQRQAHVSLVTDSQKYAARAPCPLPPAFLSLSEPVTEKKAYPRCGPRHIRTARPFPCGARQPMVHRDHACSVLAHRLVPPSSEWLDDLVVTVILSDLVTKHGPLFIRWSRSPADAKFDPSTYVKLACTRLLFLPACPSFYHCTNREQPNIIPPHV
jgi:hypothetical protein